MRRILLARWPSTGFLGGIAAATAFGLTATGPVQGDGRGVMWVLLASLLLTGPWSLFRIVMERRAKIRRRIEEARRDERLRIARELHDVAAHSMGLIAVQAGVANHVIATHPEEARNALAVIEEVSRDALREMRTLLGVLRTEGDDHTLTPSPRLADLPALTGSTPGVQVELTVDDLPALPDGIELAAYRIVQESLTNVARHAAPTRCRVSIRATTAGLAVEISDAGPSRQNTSGSGYGLVGMRERARAHGGTFTAGPRPDGGFTVRAVLPF